MYSNEIVIKILDYIELNINSKISIDSISKKLNYNRYYLMRLFKKELKISICEYINSLRIYNSLKYFKNSMSILNIAIYNGFYSEEYFSETFKNILGINPATYKKIINYNKNITENDIYIYTYKTSNLKMLLERINIYKSNKKCVNNLEKKLTIFK